MYYRPDDKSVCADVIPFYEDGEFKLFYLKDYRDIEGRGEGCPWHLLTSRDLVRYRDCGVVLPRGEREQQDLYVFTGCCVKVAGEYLIFYTGHNPHLRNNNLPEQKILMAKSGDLLHWEKISDFVFEAPDWMEMHDFRDPFVFYREDRKTYAMLLAGRFKGEHPTFSRGATFIAYSRDLYHWEVDRTPFYAPDAFFTHECPDLFRMGDWWYLVFSEFTDKIVTRYRMSKSLDGPWITPRQDTFDGHAFYAAKSACDGRRRFLFGWNCIKLNEEDDNWWQWGGNIVPHELVQADDGTLYVKCPEEIKRQYARPVSLERGFRLGAVRETQGGYAVGRNDGMSIQMFGEMPVCCRISMRFRLIDDIGDFGVILRESGNLDRHYKIKFEPKFNRLGFDKIPRKDGNVHTLVDAERYCPLRCGAEHELTAIVEGSIVEAYVDGKVAMSMRMFDFKRGNFGIYAQNMTVEFWDVGMFAGGEKA